MLLQIDRLALDEKKRECHGQQEADPQQQPLGGENGVVGQP
jgi:hypothetical protein